MRSARGPPVRQRPRTVPSSTAVTDRILDLARRLHALARTGLHFCAQRVRPRDRYAEIEQIAAELLAGASVGGSRGAARPLAAETGYVTPKIEVRGAVFRDGRVLLVRETADGRWTLPGGWADVNETPVAGGREGDRAGIGLPRARGQARRALRPQPPRPRPDAAPLLEGVLPLRDHRRRGARQLRDRRASGSSTRPTCRRCRSAAARRARWRGCSSTGAIAASPTDFD